MTDSAPCATCGTPLVDGTCTTCAPRRAFPFMQREMVAIVLLSVVVVAGFILTRRAAAANRALRLSDAAAWSVAGQGDAAAHRTDAAVHALRRAAALDRDNRGYQLALAGALAAADDHDAARQVLLRLRDTAPEDAEVNLELARLEAQRDDVPGTVRYYQSALYGRWSGDQGDARRDIRVELVRFLLSHDQRSRALSELLILSSNAPPETGANVEMGQLFLDAGDPARALDHFRRALRLSATEPSAIDGAAESTFALADYPAAQTYLHASSTPSGRVAKLRQLVDLVQATDPLAPGVPSSDRQQRVQSGLDAARDRLDRCLSQAVLPGQPPTDTETLQTLRARVDTLGGLDRPAPVLFETFEQAFSLIYEVEQTVPESCAAPTPMDRALLLIGRRHGVSQP